MCFDGTSVLQDWMVWSDHPVRKDYEIIMDLGEHGDMQTLWRSHPAPSPRT